jgi:hypothetical protein
MPEIPSSDVHQAFEVFTRTLSDRSGEHPGRALFDLIESVQERDGEEVGTALANLFNAIMASDPNS